MAFFGSTSGRGHGQRSPSRHGSSSGFYVRPGASFSRSSFFGRSGGSSSYYKRRPRDGYVAYLVYKLKRMILDLYHYARRHPVKAFFAIVVPLISAGGALHGLLKQFGIRLPMGLDGGSKSFGGGYYGSSGYDSGFGGGGESSAFGLGSIGSVLKIAQQFM